MILYLMNGGQAEVDSTKDINIFAAIIATAERDNPRSPDDYLDDEGFLVCGKCHTRKQCEVLMPAGFFGPEDQMMKVPTPCKCKMDEIEFEERRTKAQQEMLLVQDLKRGSLMDEEFKDATFENYRVDKDNEKNMKMCRRYAEHFDDMLKKNMGLLLYGKVGTGKSYTAACIANCLLEKGVSVVMTSFVKLIDAMSAPKSDNEGLILKLNRAKLLIIDDLGAERESDFALEKVFNVIDSRVRNKKPLIVTTNLKLEDIRSPKNVRMARIYDRISGLYPMQFTGMSYRKHDAVTKIDEMRRFLEGDD